jgi:hypothetical protein
MCNVIHMTTKSVNKHLLKRLSLAVHEGKWTATCPNQLTSTERASSAHWNLLSRSAEAYVTED